MAKNLILFLLLFLFPKIYAQTTTFIPGPEGYGTNSNTIDKGMIPFYREQNFLYCYTRKTVSTNPIKIRTFIVRVNLDNQSSHVYSEVELFTNQAWDVKKLNQYIFFRCGQRLCMIDTNLNKLSIISTNVDNFAVFDHYVIYENYNSPMGTHLLNLNNNTTKEIRSPENKNLYRLGATYFHDGILYFRGAYTTVGVYYAIYKYNPSTNSITELVGAHATSGSEIYQSKDEVLKVNNNLIFLMKDADLNLKYYSINLSTQTNNSSFKFNTKTIYDTAVKGLLLFNNTVYLTNNDNEVYTSDGASIPQLTNLPAFFGIGTNPNMPYINPFIYLNNFAYVGLYNSQYGTELWKYNGTHNGMSLVKDITTGDISSFYYSTNGFTHNNRIFFIVNDGPLSESLYYTDGTDTGTKNLINNSQFTKISNFIPYNNTLYFYGENGINNGLYALDLTNLSNSDFIEENTISFYPNPVKSKLYFPELVLEVKIIDMTGKIILREKNVTQLLLDHLKKGTYLVEYTNTTKTKKTKKIIKL